MNAMADWKKQIVNDEVFQQLRVSFKSNSLQVCKSASLQVCKSASLQSASLQVCSLQVSHTGSSNAARQVTDRQT